MQITLLTSVSSVAAGLAAEKGIAIARNKAIAGTPAHKVLLLPRGERTPALAGQPPRFPHHLSEPLSAMLPRAVLAPSVRGGAIESCQRRHRQRR